jgi:hypothetical protein
MKYDALSFDTQAVMTNSFDFDGGLLAQLKQFKDGQIEIVVSEIVRREILRHLRQNTAAAKAAVESTHRKVKLYGLPEEGCAGFQAEIDTDALAHARLQKYLEDIGAAVIKPDDVAMRDLIQTYFSASPPFAKSGDKKSEFPDAICLLSLEQWAKANKKRVLAVSKDGDWAGFGEKSDHLDVIDNLADALAKLQDDLDQADDIAQKLLADIKSGANAELADEFERLLKSAVENTYPHFEASSYFFLTPEGINLEFNGYEIDQDGEYLPAQVVQVGRSIIVVDLEVRVSINAEASFSLETHDSVDDDYVGMGSSTVRKDNEEENIDVLVTFEGDFEKGEVEVTNVEVVRGLKSMEFGEVELDYGDPDDDEPENEEGQEPEISVHDEPI